MNINLESHGETSFEICMKTMNQNIHNNVSVFIFKGEVRPPSGHKPHNTVIFSESNGDSCGLLSYQ